MQKVAFQHLPRNGQFVPTGSARTMTDAPIACTWPLATYNIELPSALGADHNVGEDVAPAFCSAIKPSRLTPIGALPFLFQLNCGVPQRFGHDTPLGYLYPLPLSFGSGALFLSMRPWIAHRLRSIPDVNATVLFVGQDAAEGNGVPQPLLQALPFQWRCQAILVKLRRYGAATEPTNVHLEDTHNNCGLFGVDLQFDGFDIGSPV